MLPHIAALYRYPVKGLSADALSETRLTPGEAIPFDRAYAIENGPGRFDAEAPKYLPKINFLMLMRNAKLAGLRTQFAEDSATLTIHRAGKPVAKGALNTRIGQQVIEQFLAGYMGADLRGSPRIVQAPGHAFSDISTKAISIINLASVREIERSLGRTVDPLRFRANVYIDGVEPWAEFGWLGQSITLGPDARVEVFARTMRCDATNVDPITGVADLSIPAFLQRTFGHGDCGVYAEVTAGGLVRAGDPLGLPDAARER